jgi:hypothetical protein
MPRRAGAGLVGRLVAATVGAVAADRSLDALSRQPPGGPDRWTRTNHRGEQVTLLEGPAYALGALAGVVATPGLPARARLGAVTAVGGAAVFGLYDDLAGNADARGLRGHLGALARGEVTTGAVKIGGLVGVGLVAARAAGLRGVDAVTGAGVVAGAANLLNLLDLRPGRALKVGLLHAAALALPDSRPGAGRAVLAGPVGAAAGVLRPDLAERAMLGDAGANALGAAIGYGVLTSYGRVGRLAHLAAIVALTLASERVSFTRVIEQTPVLAWADRLGRRPAAAVPDQA